MFQQDMVRAALSGDQDLVDQLCGQLDVVKGIARGRVSDRGLEVFRAVVGTALSAAQVAMFGRP